MRHPLRPAAPSPPPGSSQSASPRQVAPARVRKEIGPRRRCANSKCAGTRAGPSSWGGTVRAGQRTASGSARRTPAASGGEGAGMIRPGAWTPQRGGYAGRAARDPGKRQDRAGRHAGAARGMGCRSPLACPGAAWIACQNREAARTKKPAWTRSRRVEKGARKGPARIASRPAEGKGKGRSASRAPPRLRYGRLRPRPCRWACGPR
jgi:hypothetical protein